MAEIFKKTACPELEDLLLALDDDKMSSLRDEIIDALEGRSTDENSREQLSKYRRLVNIKFHSIACGKCMNKLVKQA